LDKNEVEISENVLKIISIFFKLDKLLVDSNMGEPIFQEFLAIDDIKKDKLEAL